MFAVIFRATINQLDSEYSSMAIKLRDLAMKEYGCTEFVSLTEGNQEIAISYWPDEAAIQQWKQQSDHLIAQSLGSEKWYDQYKVEIVEIKRSYSKA